MVGKITDYRPNIQPSLEGACACLTLLPMVPVLSSAARIPLPGATIARAFLINSSAYLFGNAFPTGSMRLAIALMGFNGLIDGVEH